MDDTAKFAQLAQNFRALIIEQCKFCHFDQWLEKNPDFLFPEITKDFLNSQVSTFIAIPGLFGGFTYYIENTDGEPVLYAEQSSRMYRDSSDNSYFKITADGNEILDGEARENARQKFCERAALAHATRKKNITEVMTQVGEKHAASR